MRYDYRVIQRDFHRGLLPGGNGHSAFMLAEVTYGFDGTPRNYDEDINLVGARSLEELEAQIDQLKEAFKRPPLKMHGNELREVKKP